MDCSPPGSSVHGILQARILEWVAISFSRGSSWPRDRTQVSRIAGRCFNLWATRESLEQVAYPFSSGSSQPRSQTRVSCTAGRFFTKQRYRNPQSLPTKWPNNTQREDNPTHINFSNFAPKAKPTIEQYFLSSMKEQVNQRSYILCVICTDTWRKFSFKYPGYEKQFQTHKNLRNPSSMSPSPNIYQRIISSNEEVTGKTPKWHFKIYKWTPMTKEKWGQELKLTYKYCVSWQNIEITRKRRKETGRGK